jgi:CBS domain-containing protein
MESRKVAIVKTLKDVMSKGVECMEPGSSLREVAVKMKELDAGSIPICDNDRLVGMVTDRDLVLETLAVDRDPDQVKAEDVMTSPIVYCFEDQDIGEAARIMEARQIRRLAVLSREKRLVGIVSLGDLSLRAGDHELAQEVLEEVSKPGRGAAA